MHPEARESLLLNKSLAGEGMVAFRSPRRVAAGFLFLVVLFLVLFRAGARPGYAQDGTVTWSRPIPISGALGGSRYPSPAAFDDGQVLVFWGVSTEEDESTLFVSQFDGAAWQRPVDVLIGGPSSKAELDGRNRIWLLYHRSPDVILTQANAAEANSSRSWGNSIRLNHGTNHSVGDFFLDRDGVAYAAWMDRGANCEDCYSVGFEKIATDVSPDLSYRVLADSVTSPMARIQVRPGAENTLYAMWDTTAEGDRFAGIALKISTDNGETWSREPIEFSTTDEDIRQPLLAVDGANNLLLVYKYGERDEVYYSLSSDQGVTWSPPAPIPGLFAGKNSDSTDYFAMARDTAGITHLVAPGRTNTTQPTQGLYHMEWDGSSWRNRQELYNGPGIPEFPAISIGNGNTLHVAFSTREANPVSGSVLSSYQVYYTVAQTNAPAATRVPLPTFTPSATPTPTPEITLTPATRPTPSPFPTPDPAELTPPPSTGEIPPLVIAIVPVAIILVGVAIWAAVFRTRR
jgi:hypothetical protein